jgi:thioredoxin-related protein
MLLRLYKAVLTGCLFLCLVPLARAGPGLPAATDLQRDGRQALQVHLPLLLEFSAADCPYCQQVEQEFLVPLLISGEYRDRVLIRRLLVNSAAAVTDFDGVRRGAVDIARRYRAHVLPTLVFLDGHGNELAGHMVGISTPELYGGYLDACIDTALELVRAPGRRVAFAGCNAVHNSRTTPPG